MTEGFEEMRVFILKAIDDLRTKTKTITEKMDVLERRLNMMSGRVNKIERDLYTRENMDG